MVKFCPQCGTELGKEYKFCPECGFELGKVQGSVEKDKKVSTPEISGSSSEIIICDNCGEENEPSAELCTGCGVRLTDVKDSKNTARVKVSSVKANKNVKPQASPKAGAKKEMPQKKVAAYGVTQKKLDNVKIITISAIGVGIAIVILIFSGVLNPLIVPGASTSSSSTQNQSSGVDLANLQKINSLEEVVKNNPKDTTSILELAHLKNDAGMFEKAIVNYKQYLKMVPTNPDARIDMGICYYNIRNYDEAIRQMEQAVKYDPRHQIGYLNLGIVNLAAGNFDKSKDWLSKAVAIDPNSEYGKKAEELLKSHENTNQMNGGK